MPTVPLDLFPAQADFLDCQDMYAAFVGGWGCGKTVAGSDWTLMNAMRWPKASHFIFSNTYAQLKAGTMVTFFDRCHHWGLRYIDRILDKRVVLPDIGATINVWTADDSNLFHSLEIDRAWVDEAHRWSHMDYLKLESRMRGRALSRALYHDLPLQLRITANPPLTMDHWLVDMTTIPIERTGKPPITLFQAATRDNYLLPPEYVQGLFDTYDPELAEIMMGGKFGDIGRGRIFRRFARGRHILSPAQAAERGLPPLTYEPSLPVFWSLDFNVSPMCSVIGQWRRVNAPGYQPITMYVLEEIRIPDSVIDTSVKEFFRREGAKVGRKNGLILYGDASGEASNRQTGESDWATVRKMLARAGYYGETRVPSANPKRRDRFNAANAKLENARGQIGVVIHERCRYLARDIERMYYKPGTSDVQIPKVDPDDPTTAARNWTHLADAFSYAIAYDFPVTDLPQAPVKTAR